MDFICFYTCWQMAYVNQIRDGEEHFSHEKNGGWLRFINKAPVPQGPTQLSEKEKVKEWIENWRMVGFWKEQRIGACIWAWKRPSWPTAYDDVKEICQPGNPIASNFSLPSPSTPTSTSGLNYNSKVPLGCPCQYQRYRIVLAQTGPTWRPICQNLCLGFKQLEISSISNL